jgi:hypothetical protein
MGQRRTDRETVVQHGNGTPREVPHAHRERRVLLLALRPPRAAVHVHDERPRGRVRGVVHVEVLVAIAEARMSVCPSRGPWTDLSADVRRCVSWLAHGGHRWPRRDVTPPLYLTSRHRRHTLPPLFAMAFTASDILKVRPLVALRDGHPARPAPSRSSARLFSPPSVYSSSVDAELTSSSMCAPFFPRSFLTHPLQILLTILGYIPGIIHGIVSALISSSLPSPTPRSRIHHPKVLTDTTFHDYRLYPYHALYTFPVPRCISCPRSRYELIRLVFLTCHPHAVRSLRNIMHHVFCSARLRRRYI